MNAKQVTAVEDRPDWWAFVNTGVALEPRLTYFDSDVRKADWSVNPGLALVGVGLLADSTDRSTARTSFALVLLGIAAAVAGVAIGTGLALLVSDAVSSLPFGVSATDPLTFATTAVAIIVVALAGSDLSARRAAHVDPMTVLRAE